MYQVVKRGPKGVTPCVGVWIETWQILCLIIIVDVTPCVGVWIETKYMLSKIWIEMVTPCVGVWIETRTRTKSQRYYESHPAWVCGLKQARTVLLHLTSCHTLRGCVD